MVKHFEAMKVLGFRVYLLSAHFHSKIVKVGHEALLVKYWMFQERLGEIPASPMTMTVASLVQQCANLSATALMDPNPCPRKGKLQVETVDRKQQVHPRIPVHTADCEETPLEEARAT